MASGSINDQGIIYPLSSLYNPPHSGPSTLTICPYIESEHFITTMVDIDTSEAWLLIISPSGAESSICLDSCLPSSEKKLELRWLPLVDNHSYNFIKLPLILEFAFH